MNTHTILITGCTKGIGRALAIKFAKAHCKVYAVGRQASELKNLAELYAGIIPVVADITIKKEREKIVLALQAENSLSIIHNAGISASAKFQNLDESVLRQHFETNCFAPILLTQALLPKLQGQRVLNISSGAALEGREYKLPYCSSKSAMNRAIESLHHELYSQGIYFSNLRPGMVDTPMQAQLRGEDVPSRDFYIQAQQKGQLFSPEKIADFVYWVMLKTDAKTFTETFWNIYDANHQNKWQNLSLDN